MRAQSAGVSPEGWGSCRTSRGPCSWSVLIKLAQNMLLCRQLPTDVATAEQCDGWYVGNICGVHCTLCRENDKLLQLFRWLLCSHSVISIVPMQSYCNFYGSHAIILQFLWFLCSRTAISIVPMQSCCNFSGSYAVILQFLWFPCSHTAISMVPMQSYCNFYSSHAVILQFLWFPCSHTAISIVPMQSYCNFYDSYTVILQFR
jgi:hypothetical protein